jgi:hypothetical protein
VRYSNRQFSAWTVSIATGYPPPHPVQGIAEFINQRVDFAAMKKATFEYEANQAEKK